MDQFSSVSSFTTQDDRIIASLAHASIILPNIGIIFPLIILLSEKEKSRYVAFQALQALVYQYILVIGWFTAIAGCTLSIFAMRFASIGFDTSGPGSELTIFLPFLEISFVLLISLGFFIYGVIAAVLTLKGRNFRYFLIGNWLLHRMNWI